MTKLVPAIVLLFGLPSLALAEESAPPAADAQAQAAGEAEPQGETEEVEVEFLEGPVRGPIGTMAEIDVPEGYLFVEQDNVAAFMEKTGNTTSPDELAVIVNRDEKDSYWALFTFDEVGYIKDAEKEELDADKMLASIRESDQRANEVRRERGLPELELLGWYKPPFYNKETQRLEWGVRFRSKDGEAINYHTRILGRSGVMSVIVVASPEELPGALPKVTRDLNALHFLPGQKYSEWKEGDKLATIGLTALVAGGAGAALAKSGLLGKIWKFLVIGAVGLMAALKKFFGKKKADPSPMPPPTEPT